MSPVVGVVVDHHAARRLGDAVGALPELVTVTAERADVAARFAAALGGTQ